MVKCQRFITLLSVKIMAKTSFRSCPSYWRKTVRAIAMDSTEGPTRGAEVVDTGRAISVPVEWRTLGRIMNVVGDPIDEKGAIETRSLLQYTKPQSLLIRQLKRKSLVTGIKSYRPFGSLFQKEENWFIWRRRVGKTVLIMELINNVAKLLWLFCFALGLEKERMKETIFITRWWILALSTLKS